MTRAMRSHIALWICLIAVDLVGCRHPPDETLIRQGIDASAAAAEQADASALSDQLSDDFAGDADTLDRQGLLNVLRVAKLRGESVHVILGPLHIEPRGDHYVASFTATLTSGGRMFPSDMGIYAVETGWRRQGHRWICYTASWHQQL